MKMGGGGGRVDELFACLTEIQKRKGLCKSVFRILNENIC